MRRELRDTLEAFEASNQELKASNEEATSINEELQSTNEELETSKEELQSLNEELLTVNTQLQNKIGELETLSNDLSNLLSNTDVAVLFLDPECRVRRYTPAVRDLVEIIPGDIGRPISDLAQKFSGVDLREDVRKVLVNLTATESEVQSNSARWYIRRTRAYRTTDNRIDGVVVTFVDISARKRSEQAIQAAEAHLRSVIDQMPTAVLMVGAPAGQLIIANRQAASLFGHPFPLPFLQAEWAAASAAFKGFHSDGRAYAADEWPLARSLATGESLTEEIGFIRPDGTQGTLSVSSGPIRNDEGTVIAAVAAFWDISERKRLELDLRESEERFRVLVEGAHDYAILMLDVNGRVVTWSSGAERLLGWSEPEMVGQPGELIFTDEDRAAHVPEQEMKRARDSGRALDERVHVRKDRTTFWGSGVLTRVNNKDGTLRGYIKILRDNTSAKKTEVRLQEALHSAQALRASADNANLAKDEFIATVSHELRTPLQTIRLWSRMLSAGRLPDKEMAEGAKMIDRAAVAQQQLIDDLLDVSRMASGKLRLQLRDTRLINAIQGAIEAVQPVAISRGVTVQADLSREVGTVRADPDRIQQVVWNLLSNAVKFTPSGGSIRVHAIRQGADVEIEVEDTGAGIRKEFLPHVFERFRQAEAATTRTHGGLGLGLAIARQLVELHGGTISAASEGEGRGATFKVRLPLPAQRSEPIEEHIEHASRKAILKGLNVLLVEDDEATRYAMRKLMEAAGARVRAVESAPAAREAFSMERPDILVADIGLPGEDGYTLLTQIRAKEREEAKPAVPALALTAFARSEDRQRALQAGFNEHLPKPTDPDKLIAAVESLRNR